MDATMLDRRDFVRQILIDRGDLLVVPGLGSATKAKEVPRVLPLRDGHAIKQRFIEAINAA